MAISDRLNKTLSEAAEDIQGVINMFTDKDLRNEIKKRYNDKYNSDRRSKDVWREIFLISTVLEEMYDSGAFLKYGKIVNFIGGAAKTGNTFDTKEVEAPISPVSAYAGTDNPLIINTVGYTIPFTKDKTGGSEMGGHLHGQSAYKGEVVNAGPNLFAKNTSPEYVMPGFANHIFLLDVERLGMDPKVLKAAMYETSQTKAYSFFFKNCIDRVIEPMQKAGCNIYFGKISTPSELSKWCEKAVAAGYGIRISEKDYKDIIQNPDKMEKIIQANREKQASKTQEPKDLQAAKESLEQPKQPISQQAASKEDVALQVQRNTLAQTTR